MIFNTNFVGILLLSTLYFRHVLNVQITIINYTPYKYVLLDAEQIQISYYSLMIYISLLIIIFQCLLFFLSMSQFTLILYNCYQFHVFFVTFLLRTWKNYCENKKVTQIKYQLQMKSAISQQKYLPKISSYQKKSIYHTRKN